LAPALAAEMAAAQPAKPAPITTISATIWFSFHSPSLVSQMIF
jgi:hypothetical protein